MRIKYLSLENYRGFEKLEVEFPEKGGAVFIGVNGSGKTSILEGCAVLLDVFYSEITEVNPITGLSKKDIKLNTGGTSLNGLFIMEYDKLEIHADYKGKIESREPAGIRGDIFEHFKERVQSKIGELIEKNGKLLSISQLSHGEKGIMAMVGDLARRLSIANPDLEDPLLGAGIVLIDEIELHLHPAWQRTIILKLESAFPNIQFIATTHSPQILSSLKRENVFILEDFKLVEKTPHTFGRDSNSILQDLFNVAERPEDAKEEFRRLYRSMDDPKKAGEASDMLNEMEGKYGSDDPEIILARMHQEFINEE